MKRAKNSEMQKENAKGLPQWEKDLLLKPASRDMLQSEYLELGKTLVLISLLPLNHVLTLSQLIFQSLTNA